MNTSIRFLAPKKFSTITDSPNGVAWAAYYFKKMQSNLRLETRACQDSASEYAAKLRCLVEIGVVSQRTISDSYNYNFTVDEKIE